MCCPDLENHLVGELALAQAEGVLEVRLEHTGIRMLGDDLKNLLVDGGLIGLALLRGLVLLLLGLEDVSVLLCGLLVAGLGLDASEVIVVDAVLDLQFRDVQAGGSGHQVALVDAAEGASVQLQGSWKESKFKYGYFLLGLYRIRRHLTRNCQRMKLASFVCQSALPTFKVHHYQFHSIGDGINTLISFNFRTLRCPFHTA